MLRLEDLVQSAYHEIYFVCYNEEKSILMQGTQQELKDYDLDLEVDFYWIGDDGKIHAIVMTETETPLSDLMLSTRCYNALKRYGIDTIERLMDLWENDKKRICTIRNIGTTCLDEISNSIHLFKNKEAKREKE